MNRIITSCSKINAEEDMDIIASVKHKIPHRFEPIQNLLYVTWCCHCGNIITPISKKGAVKCSECHSVSHAKCSGLVSHFCGLSVILIDQLRSAVELSEKSRMMKAPISYPTQVGSLMIFNLLESFFS